VDEPALEWLTDTVHQDLVQGAQRSPVALIFLLRRYAQTGRDDLRDVVEQGLTDALDAIGSARDPRDRCEWLNVLVEAAAVSDDDRLAGAVKASLPQTIDDLERLVGKSYEPGEGLVDKDLVEHLRSASALLIAFGMTGRLPYSMLAEELLQAARRRWWDEEHASFGPDFASNCEAVRVLLRLAALHDDPEYLQTAVVANDATCALDARRALAALETAYRAHATAAASYGLALLDCSR
jgi:hypothetical protein